MSDALGIGTVIQAMLDAYQADERGRERAGDRNRLLSIVEAYKKVGKPAFDTTKLDAEAGRVDPEALAAQKRALASLRGISDAGGHTLQDQAVLNKVLGQQARTESAGRNAILQNMAARGQASSGNLIAAQLANQQGAANRANEVGLGVAAQAQKRALDAMMAQGRLGGEMQDRDYRARQARDVMNQFNQKNSNIYAQQRYSNDMGAIAARAGATNPVVTLNENERSADAKLTAGRNAALGTGIDELVTEYDTGDPYDTEPTGYGDEKTRKRIDKAFNNG